MKVAVLILGNTVGKPAIRHRGEWDGKRIDGEFARVTGLKDPVHVAYLFQDEHADMVLNELMNAWQARKVAEDAFTSTLYSMRNQFAAR